MFLLTSHKLISFVGETLPRVSEQAQADTIPWENISEKQQCPLHLGVQRSPVTPTSVGARQRRATYKPHASAICCVVCSPPPRHILSYRSPGDKAVTGGRRTPAGGCSSLLSLSLSLSPASQPCVQQSIAPKTLSINEVVRTPFKVKQDSPRNRNANHLKSKRIASLWGGVRAEYDARTC